MKCIILLFAFAFVESQGATTAKIVATTIGKVATTTGTEALTITIEVATTDTAKTYELDLSSKATLTAGIGASDVVITKTTHNAGCATGVYSAADGTAGELAAADVKTVADHAAHKIRLNAAAAVTAMCYKVAIAKVTIKTGFCAGGAVILKGDTGADAVTFALAAAAAYTTTLSAASASPQASVCEYCPADNIKAGPVVIASGYPHCVCGAAVMTTGVLCEAGKKCGKSTGDMGTAAATDVYTCNADSSSDATSVVYVTMTSLFFLLSTRKMMC